MNLSIKQKFLIINTLWFFLISPTMINGLPNEIFVDFEHSIYMEYVIDQTYNEQSSPTMYKKSTTDIIYNITFDSNYRWRSKSSFLIRVWLSTCTSLLDYRADFDYIFPNTTRQIQLVLDSKWEGLENQYPSIYSGICPDDKEYFLLDEMMIIRDEDGVRDELFNKIGTGNITIDEKTYDTNIFELNTSFSIPYYGWVSYMIYYDYYTLHHYDISSGILLFSNTTIYEQGNGEWANHSFIRKLTEFTDLLEGNNNEVDFLTRFYEYLYDNVVPLTILTGIILGTFLALRQIHRNNLKRGFEEFKEIRREEKIPSKEISDKEIKK